MPWYQQDGWTILLWVLWTCVSIQSAGGTACAHHQDLPLPLASAGAVAEHDEHNLEEQEMSVRK